MSDKQISTEVDGVKLLESGVDPIKVAIQMAYANADRVSFERFVEAFRRRFDK